MANKTTLIAGSTAGIGKAVSEAFAQLGYRFGFNGQHKDNEVAGIGNHNTALFWEYDTRLGRRWNLDPVDQISISNYATFGNNPIFYSDVLGDSIIHFNKNNSGLFAVSKIDFYKKDGVVMQEIENAKKNGMNVTVLSDIKELSMELKDKGVKYENIVFGGHGNNSGDEITMINSYNSNSLKENAATLKSISEYVNDNIVITACFSGLKTSDYDDRKTNKGNSLITLSILTGKTIVGITSGYFYPSLIGGDFSDITFKPVPKSAQSMDIIHNAYRGHSMVVKRNEVIDKGQLVIGLGGTPLDKKAYFNTKMHKLIRDYKFYGLDNFKR
jgi:hypothetical protein